MENISDLPTTEKKAGSSGPNSGFGNRRTFSKVLVKTPSADETVKYGSEYLGDSALYQEGDKTSVESRGNVLHKIGGEIPQ